MVYICEEPVSTRLTLNEYVEFVRDNVDPADYESMCEASWALRALANDRDLVLGIYHDELKRWGTNSNYTLTSNQSVLLHVDPSFYVRCNVWPAANRRRNRGEDAAYAYGVAHNHNYHFCTVGYFGPGYPTDLFRCEIPPMGVVNELVELADFRSETLKPGATMVYEAFKDVHTQMIPESVSVTLNLVNFDPNMDAAPQCIFDVEQRRVVGSVGTALARKHFVVDLLRYMHNEESIDLLTTLAIGGCVRTSALALNVLEEIKPDEFNRIFPRAPGKVRDLCRKRLVLGDDFVPYGVQREMEDRASEARASSIPIVNA